MRLAHARYGSLQLMRATSFPVHDRLRRPKTAKTDASCPEKARRRTMEAEGRHSS